MGCILVLLLVFRKPIEKVEGLQQEPETDKEVDA